MNSRQKTIQRPADRQAKPKTAGPDNGLERQNAGYQDANDLPALLNSEVPVGPTYRQASILRMQHQVGNRRVQRLLEKSNPGPSSNFIQRKGGKKKKSGSGTGPGAVKGAKEEYYDVSGETLDDITGQLNKYDGFASETYIGLGIKNDKVTPKKEEDGSYKATISWVTADEVTRLPRWVDYKKACPAAKKEWDRFMTQTRTHEQQAHIDASQKFLKELGEEDKVITGVDLDDFRANLEAKQQELGQRLQDIHDACDHGVSIDALLHPDKGQCEEETE